MGWVLDGECGTPNLPGDVVFLPLLMATGPPGTGGGWGGSGDPRVSSAAVTLGDNSVTGCHVIKIEKKCCFSLIQTTLKGKKILLQDLAAAVIHLISNPSAAPPVRPAVKFGAEPAAGLGGCPGCPQLWGLSGWMPPGWVTRCQCHLVAAASGCP